MRCPKRCKAIAAATVTCFLVYLFAYYDDLQVRYYNYQQQDFNFRYGHPRKDSVFLATTSCGSLILMQTLTMIKSAVAFTDKPLHFVIFTDETGVRIKEEILKWPPAFLAKLSFEIKAVTFPRVRQRSLWYQAFKPCSSQRLFYHQILPDYERIVHLDNDVLFLDSPGRLWQQFERMESLQQMAMATENMDHMTSWYKKLAKIPYVGEFGVNSGVILMNLKRLRQVHFEHYLEPIVDFYREKLVWFDQDILNAYFYDRPDQLLLLSCRWNYLVDHCLRASYCLDAEKKGIGILHGSRETFLKIRGFPPFQAVYQIFDNYEPASDIETNIVTKIQFAMKGYPEFHCVKVLNSSAINFRN